MSSSPCWVRDGSLDKLSLKAVVLSCSEGLGSSSREAQLTGASQLYSLIVLVWSLDTRLARDAADIVCEHIRDTGGLESLIRLCSSSDKPLRLAILKALEQIMVADNREYIAGHKLFNSVVKVASSNESLEAIQAGTGILENLFKDSTQTCLRLIRSSALEGLILGCRSTDLIVLQHCAAALANCAMYGEETAHAAMVTKYVDHWLFPLALSSDEVVKYYALLAICFLAANSAISHKIVESGTLDVVLPFLKQHDPEEFTRSCPNHAHGRSVGWLHRLVPLLSSQSEEARSLVAFHFAMEAAIKKKQNRLQILSDIDVYGHLRTAAKIGSKLTAKFCVEALVTCSQAPPPYQCWNVVQWSVAEVVSWVNDTIPSTSNVPDFTPHHVTGSVLLDLTVDDLMEVGFVSRVACKGFLGEVRKLRCRVDTSGTESKDVCKWLTDHCRDLAVYRADFSRKGITRSLLPHLTDEILTEIGVGAKLDRLRISLAVRQSINRDAFDTPDQGGAGQSFILPSPSSKKSFDVFISYRRSTGSQLASLLKVHLQLRGLSVFLDVAELGSGKFDEAILNTIERSSNFLLVLSEACLDRCHGDTHVQDWLHKEIVSAVENKKHSIPVIESNFKWPAESKLPADISQICTWNGVLWSHEYQEASVEKLVSFLQLSPGARRMRSNTRSYISFNSIASEQQ